MEGNAFTVAVVLASILGGFIAVGVMLLALRLKARREQALFLMALTLGVWMTTFSAITLGHSLGDIAATGAGAVLLFPPAFVLLCRIGRKPERPD